MGAWRRGTCASGFLALSLALLGCEPPPDTDARPPAACPAVVYDQAINVPATSTTLRIDTRATVQGTDAADDVSVDLTDNRGTVAFFGSGPVPAFIYRRTPWPDLGVTLFAGLGFTDGAWIPFWLYCAPDGALTELFAERTDRTATFATWNVTGTCAEVLGDWDMPVEVPAHELRDVSITCGFSVSETSSLAPLSLVGSQPGTASVFGLTASVLVFSAVDCRTECGSRSWFELHSIVQEPTTGQVGFAIWYLDGRTSGTGVLAANGLTFPSAGWADISYPTATWTLDR